MNILVVLVFVVLFLGILFVLTNWAYQRGARDTRRRIGDCLGILATYSSGKPEGKLLNRISCILNKESIRLGGWFAEILDLKKTLL